MHTPRNPLIILTNVVKKQQGFTLIELLVGMVALALVLPMVATLLFPVMEQSLKHIHQIRAAELGQSIMNEIVDKAFDENSDRAGGKIRCGEQIIGLETINCSTILGRDGNEFFENFDVATDDNDQAIDNLDYAFDNFDDVDDYHGVQPVNFISALMLRLVFVMTVTMMECVLAIRLSIIFKPLSLFQSP